MGGGGEERRPEQCSYYSYLALNLGNDKPLSFM